MQVILVIAIVAAAAGYLGWQFYKNFFVKKAKRDGCGMGKMSAENKI